MDQLQQKVNLKRITQVSLALMAVVMLWVSKDFGITGDEVTQNTYGQKVFDYFASFGADTSALQFKNVYFYGGFYDLLCVTVNKIFHLDEFNTRHFINAIFGFLGIVFSSLLAKRFGGWGAALLTAWFLFLSPRFFGESMNNPKDIPFALGMVMSFYFMFRFLDAFPKPTWKDALWLALSIGFAIGIRVGGLILIPLFFVGLAFYYWFDWRKRTDGVFSWKAMIIRAGLIALGGYLAGLIFWPYGLQAPFSNPFKALGEMSQFSTGIRMLYDDAHIMSSDVPWYYIPKWIWITSPIIILLGLVLSPVTLFNKKYSFHKIALLFFVFFFPLLYIIYKKSPLYDGWRHLLFIYPGICILSALAFTTVAEWLKQQYARYAVYALVVIGLVFPAKWILANHPNQIVYFNEFQGGVDGAFGYYETDYYMNSIKQATFKLAEIEDLYHTKDTVVIATNCIEPMYHYVAKINPKIKCEYVRYYQRYDKKWDYCILFSRFVDKNLLQNGFFPPSNSIYTVMADHTPLTAVLKSNAASENAYNGFTAMGKQDFANAVLFYQKALQEDPRNETVYNYLGLALANSGRLKEAIDVINRGLAQNPANGEAYQMLAQLYQAVGDMQNAQMANYKLQQLMQPNN